MFACRHILLMLSRALSFDALLPILLIRCQRRRGREYIGEKIEQLAERRHGADGARPATSPASRMPAVSGAAECAAGACSLFSGLRANSGSAATIGRVTVAAGAFSADARYAGIPPSDSSRASPALPDSCAGRAASSLAMAAAGGKARADGSQLGTGRELVRWNAYLLDSYLPKMSKNSHSALCLRE